MTYGTTNASQCPSLQCEYAYVCLITKALMLTALGSLDDLRRCHLKLSTKHAVPEAARDAETVLIVCEVVLEVVLLQLLVVLRKPSGN
jgi:hypothetical protein